MFNLILSSSQFMHNLYNIYTHVYILYIIIMFTVYNYIAVYHHALVLC